MSAAPDELTTLDLTRIADALDVTENLHGALSTDARARVFAAINEPTRETWVAARSLIVRPSVRVTLWSLVAHYTCDHREDFTPSREQIIEALTGGKR